ncbi:MAG: class I SAM-dependent methyltransferase [Pirellulales bacterium]
MNIKRGIEWVRRRLRTRSSRRIYELTHHVRDLRAQLERSKQDIEAIRELANRLRDELFQVPSLPPLNFLDHPLNDRLQKARDEMDGFVDTHEITDDEHFYLLMQMVFRGPIQVIRDQLKAVLDSISIPDEIRRLQVVDIGCGRGELLNLLREKGFEAVGVDTSHLMVHKLAEQNMPALEGDGCGRLESFADGSLCGVTAFHFIEHVQPEYLKRMLAVAYRKIAPGGFILLETPNPFCPESLSFFYTDDSHVRPIQPFQLAFLVENAGFENTRAHFSAPVPAGRRQSIDNWLRLYQNHGLVAYKPRAAALAQAA